MVAEPWILKMGNQVSTNLKHALLLEHSSKKMTASKKQEHKHTVGILSFEVANVMSKTVHLHKSLTDHEISKLRNEILKSEGVRNVVSSDETHLLELAVAEKLDDLNRVAGVVSRLGKKCTVPALQGFEHVYGDIVSGAIDVKALGFLVKDMEGMVRKMERYVNSTANLYGEMEVLNELEQATKKFQQNQHEESRKAFEQKLMWQKQDVRHLKDVSLWNQTYDKVVELLARTICTIYARICLMFGDAVLRRELIDDSVSADFGQKSGQFDLHHHFRVSSDRLRPVPSKSNAHNHSGLIERAVVEKRGTDISPQLASRRGEVPLFRPEDFNFACGIGPGRLFMECLSLSSSASKVDDDEAVVHDDRSSQTSACCSSVASAMKRELPNHSGCITRAQSGVLYSIDPRQAKGSVINGSQFGPKSRLPLYAPPSTVGGSALALHYANVIIVIEKFLRYPHLVGEEARDDLYQMLPTSLRMSLKTSLKSYVKDLAIYDAPLAHDWKERLDEILRWLAPLAHNMIRWQSEHNFVDKAIRESDDQRLKTKYNNAIYVIRRAFALYPIKEVAFSFNGGKDSTVLLHLLRAGHFLHQAEQSHSNGDVSDCKFTCPIRTIYFESSSAFPEINSFTYETASTYGLQLDIIRLDFKSGLEALLKAKPIRAIFLGVRIGDPTAVGQEQFSPSSPGWPPFMRVNPVLDWSYRDVWAFLLTCKVRYCSLYDQGYTSIGSIHDTVPNALLSIKNSGNSKEKFRPAYLLPDGRLERAGRAKKYSPPVCGCVPAVSNGVKSVDVHENGMLTASVIAVGDEILFGTIEDQLGRSLCRKLCSIGWAVSRISVVRNDIDAVAEEVEQQKSANDLVFIYGGVGPLHSDVTVAGIAKAFGVRMAPDEEFEEYLTHLIGDKCTGDRNEMAQLPEGVTELLHHEKLPVPLIKCRNVIILSATNIIELDRQWDCLIELTRSSSSGLLVLAEPFVSKRLRTNLSDVETAQPLSKLCLEFPDLYIGCYRESRCGPLVISFEGKDQARVEAAEEALRKKFHPGACYEIN